MNIRHLRHTDMDKNLGSPRNHTQDLTKTAASEKNQIHTNGDSSRRRIAKPGLCLTEEKTKRILIKWVNAYIERCLLG